MPAPEEGMDDLDRSLEAAMLDLLTRRARGKTICPSEAARQVAPGAWRSLMERTRAAAERLVATGEVVMTQHGRVVDPSQAKGAVRLRRNEERPDDGGKG